MSEKPRVYLVGGKEDRPEDDWRDHKEDQHIPANHRGDDINTIGSFPCDCFADLEDEREGKHEKAGRNLIRAFELAIEQIKGK